MLTFSMDNGCVITFRTSGTEPKIKFYSELKATATTEYGRLWPHLSASKALPQTRAHLGTFTFRSRRQERADVDRRLRSLVKSMVNHLLTPEKYGLEAKKEE